jgi:hypothetical protein
VTEKLMLKSVLRNHRSEGYVHALPLYEPWFTLSQLADKVAKLAHKTHKDRVSEFNAKLEALSEHHDIPKVNRSHLPCLGILFNIPP